MFCPKCGRFLERDKTGELLCRWGEMGLSRRLEHVLAQRYADDAPPQSTEPPFAARLHGGVCWFCPGCGKPLNAGLACESCHKHLRDLVFTLVDLHPHRKVESP